MKKTILIAASFFLTACGVITPDTSEFKSQTPATPATEDVIELEDGQKVVKVGPEVNRFAPFYAQAPDGDWSLPWKEACEESSLILAHYGMMQDSLSKAKFKEMVLSMVEWQKENFGYYEDTTLEETQTMYQEFFEDALETRIIENPDITQLIGELARGNLIVAPFAGQMLGNPFYSGEGPYYHMLVIKGYDQEHFITNDVGTKRGEDFLYDHRTLMSSLHDYRETNIENAPSRVLVLIDPATQE